MSDELEEVEIEDFIFEKGVISWDSSVGHGVTG
jgi:hypothetical protein